MLTEKLYFVEICGPYVLFSLVFIYSYNTSMVYISDRVCDEAPKTPQLCHMVRYLDTCFCHFYCMLSWKHSLNIVCMLAMYRELKIQISFIFIFYFYIYILLVYLQSLFSPEEYVDRRSPHAEFLWIDHSRKLNFPVP